MTTVAVIGAGVMGAGIAQVALESGARVALHDPLPAALDAAHARIADGLARAAARLGLDAESIEAWTTARQGGLRGAETIEAAVAGADVVIEAVPEDVEVKRRVLATADAAAPADVILATNTSALSIAAIAAGVPRPARVVGLHFFNPAPRMALVEVVAGEATDPAVTQAAARLVAAWGKTPVRSADRPGFIVNRCHRPFTIEALRLLEGRRAAAPAIDGAMRDAGFPLGPFELMDLIGIDVNLAVAEAIWQGLGRPEHLRPSPIQRRLVAAGRLGRKSGEGFYRYADRRPAGATTDMDWDAPGTGLPASAIRERILGAIDRECRAALAEGVADAATIDLALRLGAGHPEPILTTPEAVTLAAEAAAGQL